jgi:hypothetical protein
VKKGHTEEQILRALHQAEGGAKVADICREHGVSEATYYVWKKKYSGLGLSELREGVLRLRFGIQHFGPGYGTITNGGTIGWLSGRRDRPPRTVLVATGKI